MLIKKQSQTSTTFNDGILKSVSIRNGGILKDLSSYIPFGQKTVGYNRFFRAYNNDIKISKVVVVPFESELQDADYVECGFFREHNQPSIYKVVQCQELLDSKPMCLQLSLEKVKTKFDDRRLNESTN